MGMQVGSGYFHQHHNPPTLPLPSTALSLYSSSLSRFIQRSLQRLSLGFSSISSKITTTKHGIEASSNVPLWDSWKPDNSPLLLHLSVIFFGPLQKYNMFMAQIGCAAIGVIAFSVFGPGWLARSAALAASIAFMIYTRSTHPLAASLPLVFIDRAKFHHLHFWYAFCSLVLPGASSFV